VIPLLLIALQLAAPAMSKPSPSDCTAADLAALDRSAALVARGDDDALRDVGAIGGPTDRCALVNLHRLSLVGWAEARDLAAKGGAVELLGPVRQLIEELEQLKGADLDIEAEYAQTAIRAAIAAAQDERAEMELLLAHARDLAERLMTRGRRAVWPRLFNLVAGELWFEVDRFDDARAAFERAVRADASGVALVGLARALSRLGRQDEACAVYRRVHDASSSLRERAKSDLAPCQ